MNMDEQQLTYEQFKEDILRWKNTHREEYVRFARLMTKEQLILSALSAFGFFICLSTMPTIASKLLP